MAAARELVRSTSVKVCGLIAVVVLCWQLVLPTGLGGSTTYTIVSGPSMQPRFHTGDLVIARPAARYQVGQVVIYRIPDPQYSRYRVVHRIVEKLPDGRYMAQGDNQDHPDPWVIPHGNIVGGQVAAIAKGGYLLSYLRNPIYLGLAFACLVTFLFWPSKECETSEATSAMVGGMHTDELNVVAPVPALAVVEAATRTERVEHRDNLIVLTEDAPGLRPASWVVGLPTRPESDVDVFIREWINACSDDREHPGAEACGRSRDRGLRSEAVLV